MDCAWVKTGPSTLGRDGEYGNGDLIAFDYYGDSGYLREHSSDNPRNDVDPNWQTYIDDPTVYVPMNSDWTFRKIDYIVPEKVIAWDSSTNSWQFKTPTGIIPWLAGHGYTTYDPVTCTYVQDQGLVWFADAELYINP